MGWAEWVVAHSNHRGTEQVHMCIDLFFNFYFFISYHLNEQDLFGATRNCLEEAP